MVGLLVLQFSQYRHINYLEKLITDRHTIDFMDKSAINATIRGLNESLIGVNDTITSALSLDEDLSQLPS